VTNNGKVVKYPNDIAWAKAVKMEENRLAVWNCMQSVIFGALVIELRE